MDNESQWKPPYKADASGQQIEAVAKTVNLPSDGVPPHPLDRQWHMRVEGQNFGPFTGHKLKEFALDGRLEQDTQVVSLGSEVWTDADEDPVLKRFFSSKNPTNAGAGPVSVGDGSTVVQVINKLESRPSRAILEMGENKSPGLALFLSLVFVGLGQIYNGEIGKGILMFFGCILLWAVLLGWIINIWSMVDAYSRAKEKRTKYELWFANSVAR